MQCIVKPQRKPWAMIAQTNRAATGQGQSLGVRRTFVRSARLVLLIGFWLLGSRQPLFAQTNAGADPAHPLFPTDAWLALPAGASHWYAFRDEGDDTPIVVRMTLLPEHSASFWVLTADDVRQWAHGEALSAVGAGSEMKLFRNDLYWTGRFVQSGTYYVLVKNNGQRLSNYQITIDGSGVSFPVRSFTQPSTATALPNGYPTGNRLPPATLDTTPAVPNLGVTASAENPLPPIGKLSAIAMNDVHWYAFRDEGDASTIQISADATPDTCLTFAIWTPEQFRLWQRGEDVKPVGQGTANPTLKIDLFWTGSFVKSGIYYVVVRRNPIVQGNCSYKLTVLGDDVSLVMPPTP